MQCGVGGGLHEALSRPGWPGLQSSRSSRSLPALGPQADSGRGVGVTALGLAAGFLVWGTSLGLSFCPLKGELAHVSSEFPHTHGLRVTLDVRNCIPTACPITGDEVRVGGLDFHHACRIAPQACQDRSKSEILTPFVTPVRQLLPTSYRASMKPGMAVHDFSLSTREAEFCEL